MMDVKLSPEQEATFLKLAAAEGRRPDELVQDVLGHGADHTLLLAEFKTSLDQAESSLDHGEGLIITKVSMRQLAEDVKQRGRARLAAEKLA